MNKKMTLLGHTVAVVVADKLVAMVVGGEQGWNQKFLVEGTRAILKIYLKT